MNVLSKWLLAPLVFMLSQSLFANSFKTEKWQTANGARVVFYQAMEVPILYTGLAFAAGSAYEGSQYGLSTLTASLFNQGSRGKDANQTAEDLANTGAQYTNEVSRDMVMLSLKTLTQPEELQKSIDTFATIINQPDFPEDAFNREKSQQLLAIEQTKEIPEDLANQLFFQKLYQNHPYGHPINGTKESVTALKRADLIRFYQRYFVASNLVIVLVGAIDSKEAHHIADKLAANLPKGNKAPPIPEANLAGPFERISVSFPSSQTILRIGQIGITHRDPDFFPLFVGNYILGGGALVSKLSLEVREKRGLTYGVTSQFMPMPGKGPFVISLSTRNKEAPTALRVTMDTLASYLNEGPSEAELVAAKHYLTGNFPLSLSSNASIANLLIKVTFYQLPEDYLDSYLARINAVTSTEIKHAFQKKLHINDMLILSVGKP
ncbi:MAG: pitrilysin family protein [Tatlockia sp.]|jgi:zinc protease